MAKSKTIDEDARSRRCSPVRPSSKGTAPIVQGVKGGPKARAKSKSRPRGSALELQGSDAETGFERTEFHRRPPVRDARGSHQKGGMKTGKPISPSFSYPPVRADGSKSEQPAANLDVVDYVRKENDMLSAALSEKGFEYVLKDFRMILSLEEAHLMQRTISKVRSALGQELPRVPLLAIMTVGGVKRGSRSDGACSSSGDEQMVDCEGSPIGSPRGSRSESESGESGDNSFTGSDSGDAEEPSVDWELANKALNPIFDGRESLNSDRRFFPKGDLQIQPGAMQASRCKDGRAGLPDSMQLEEPDKDAVVIQSGCANGASSRPHCAYEEDEIRTEVVGMDADYKRGSGGVPVAGKGSSDIVTGVRREDTQGMGRRSWADYEDRPSSEHVEAVSGGKERSQISRDPGIDTPQTAGIPDPPMPLISCPFVDLIDSDPPRHLRDGGISGMGQPMHYGGRPINFGQNGSNCGLKGVGLPSPQDVIDSHDQGRLNKEAVAQAHNDPVHGGSFAGHLSREGNILREVKRNAKLDQFRPTGLVDSGNLRIHKKLGFYPPINFPADGPTVCFSEEVIDRGVNYWKNTLIGYFIDSQLPFQVVQSIARQFWRCFGFIEVISNNSGCFLFRFDSEENMIKVFDGGPWHFTQCPLILRIWEVGMDFSRAILSAVPIWVKIFNIPLEGWNEEGIATAASALGRPIHADFMTEDRTQVEFARVCVEMDASSEFPRHINLYQGIDESTGEPKLLRMPVEYQWIPPTCSHCRVFGHSLAKCPNRSSQLSQPMQGQAGTVREKSHGKGKMVKEVNEVPGAAIE
ncbi:uncharacterized protein LOC127812192 isoform X2 [Diospyros lotus]|uniref:uncharacterized protein LOC127812192 isoform X2 n=1 Tax=Diospyros lotus TaxID=55363 RepID=UPI00225A138C|nr:uncharacterized protein LOC127812192 isoform X2 [Diospyros lotus]